MTDAEAQAIANHFGRQAIAVMRARDRAVAIAGFQVAAEQAQAALTAELGQAAALEAALSAATATERKAQDRARDAARYASRCTEDARRAERDQASPERQTAAIGKARDAAEVAAKAQAAHTAAAGARETAETALGEHRKRVSVLEDAAVAARKQEENPPALVPMRELTAISGHPLMILAQPDADDYTKACVSIQVEAVAGMCGITDRIRAEARREGREEAEKEHHKRPVLVPTGDGASSTLISPTGTWRGGRH
jgi:hypothetical protein